MDQSTHSDTKHIHGNKYEKVSQVCAWIVMFLGLLWQCSLGPVIAEECGVEDEASFNSSPAHTAQNRNARGSR